MSQTNSTVRKSTPANYITQKQKYRMREDMLRLKWALDDCENIVTYNREQLHRIYREIYRDPQLRSQWTTRKLKTIEKEFRILDKNDNPVDDAKAILETQWFMDLMDEILESKLWGFRLIEFGPVVNGKLTSYRDVNNRVHDPINVIEPDNVKPEFGVIVKDPAFVDGIPFEGGPWDKNLLFVGRRHDMGIMVSAVKYVLFKNNCAENWSEWAEVFGMDIRYGKTYAEGDARQAFLDTLKKLGSSGYGVIDKEDEIIFGGTSRTDAYKVYESLMDTTDKNLAKLIFGQDVVSNNTGRVVGEVGENVANLYGDSDAKFVSRIINYYVLPKLTALGLYNFENLKFKWDTSEKLTLDEQSQIDLRIAQMGYKPAKPYLEEKYNIKLEDAPDPVKIDPNKPVKVKVNSALRELYATAQ